MSSTKGNAADEVEENGLIRGRYRLDQRLAKGGMGTVYRGTDTALNRDVAIKMLHATKDTDDPEQLVERFRREAEALAKLNHRHIVTIFDYGPTESGGYFLVMEFVDGKPLSGLVKEDDLDPQRAIRLGMQLAQALRYAHKSGIVHRDIKMGNVLVAQTDDGDVAKLVDFGLVRVEKDERLTAHGLILGSTHCMSPEQIKGMAVDARTDIYALGCVLFRLLTGRYPFNSAHPTEVMAAHLHAPVPRFLEVKPDLVVPAGLEGIVRKCLAKEPEERYQEAGALAHDLRQCLDVPPSEFVSVTIIDESGALLKPKSSPWRVGGLLTAIAVLLGLLGLNQVGVLSLGGEASVGPATVAAAQQVQTEEEPAAKVEPKAVEPQPQQEEPEPEPEPQPEPEPEPAVAAPRPAPVVRPPPRPAPAPPPPPEPEEEEENDAVAAVEPVPPPPPEPTYDVVLEDVQVTKGADRVEITLKMSNSNVRPLKFAAEGSDPVYPKQYRVTFRGGGANYATRKVPVGGTLVDNVSIVEGRGSLTIIVNSPSTPKMHLEGTGPDYRIVVGP